MRGPDLRPRKRRVEFWPLAEPLSNGCWEWRGTRNRDGYATHGGRRAHQVAYRELIGTVPPGLEIDHLCHNRWCVNPTHMEPVTHQENMRRSLAFRTTCPSGHPYDSANTYLGSGYRRCKACAREATRRYQRRKAVA